MSKKWILLFQGLFWSSLPLLGGLAYWEIHLDLSRTQHILVELGVMFLVYQWAWFWFSQSEKERAVRLPEKRNSTMGIEIHSVPVQQLQQEQSPLDDHRLPHEVEMNELELRGYGSNH